MAEISLQEINCIALENPANMIEKAEEESSKTSVVVWILLTVVVSGTVVAGIFIYLKVLKPKMNMVTPSKDVQEEKKMDTTTKAEVKESKTIQSKQTSQKNTLKTEQKKVTSQKDTSKKNTSNKTTTIFRAVFRTISKSNVRK